MHQPIRRHLTFANIVSLIALFLALGGGAYAAFQLPKNSVRSKNIVDKQVKKRDLGVPARYTEVGFNDQFGGCPGGVNEWRDATFFNGPVSYYRDPFGIVHLRGTALRCGTVSDVIFTLPAGYRPNGNALDTLGVKNQTDAHAVRILSNGEVSATTPGLVSGNTLSFEGITFRCAPSGEHGCP